jgi:uncharacterized membrane protein
MCSVLAGLLPGLVLRLLLGVMPSILAALIIKTRRRLSFAQVDQQVMLMFFIFREYLLCPHIF